MGNGHMHYSIMLRCLLMIALFIYFLSGSFSYFELLNSLCWCGAIFNNPDLLSSVGLMEIFTLYWVPVAAFLLTPECFILGCFWDDGCTLRMTSTHAHLRSTPKKRSAGFHFVAKECPNLNLLQGSSPCSFSQSNVHRSRVQVDLCPLADFGSS